MLGPNNISQAKKSCSAMSGIHSKWIGLSQRYCKASTETYKTSLLSSQQRLLSSTTLISLLTHSSCPSWSPVSNSSSRHSCLSPSLVMDTQAVSPKPLPQRQTAKSSPSRPAPPTTANGLAMTAAPAPVVGNLKEVCLILCLSLSLTLLFPSPSTPSALPLPSSYPYTSNTNHRQSRRSLPPRSRRDPQKRHHRQEPSRRRPLRWPLHTRIRMV